VNVIEHRSSVASERESKRESKRESFPYKMKDLCERTGLDRQVIHFYIQQGLLPEGKKTGRNMAYYGEQHIERIRLIRKLQHERFLPLKAIKALLEERDDAFSPEQQRMLADVKMHLSFVARGAEERASIEATPTLALDEALSRTGLERRDVDELAEVGMLALVDDGRGSVRVARDDLWMLELFGQLRAAGFTRALGFTARDFTMLDEAVTALFRKETVLLAKRLSHLPPSEIASMVERALPILGAALVRAHETKVRNFFAAM
jgi:DNA-binding transcriptional MerR regulator